jgi:Stress responsive A/B Barrel Domain
VTRLSPQSPSKTFVSHVVLMKPRPDLSPADRDAFVAAFERAVREIPSIRGVRIGRRVTHGAGYEAATAADRADFLAMLDFDDLAGLQAYLRHPAHHELGARFGVSLSAAIVMDFEAGGIEALRAGGFLESEPGGR